MSRGGDFAPVVRRLLSLFERRCDEFSSYMIMRSSASAACSRNLDDHPNERHLPPLSRQHGSMAEALKAPVTCYHDLKAYSLTAEGYGSSLSASTSYDDSFFFPFFQPTLNNWEQIPEKASSTSRSSPIGSEGPAHAPLPSVSISGRSLPPYLKDGYQSYVEKLRQGRIAPHLEPSYEEYSRALMMEMDFSATSKEVARRLVRATMKRGAVSEVKGSKSLTNQWTEEMAFALARDKGQVLEALKGNSTLSSLDYQSSYYTILHTLRPHRLAEIATESESSSSIIISL